VPRRISQGSRAIVERTRSPHDAQLFTQSRTLRTTQLLGLDGSTGYVDLTVPAATIVPTPIFIVFRRPEADLNSCENRPRQPASLQLTRWGVSL
jgi:hypothetical protein